MGEAQTERWSRMAFRVWATAIVALTGPTAWAATAFYGPTPYFSQADSPFAGVSFDAFHLEDFENGGPDTPGVQSTTGGFAVEPGPRTDSVDGDDGTLDGNGAAGRSFYSGMTTTVFTFVFDAGALGGRLPTHAGIVWTDVGFVDAGGTDGFTTATFQAFDGADVLIGTIPPAALGDGSTFGETAEDRFFGVRHDAGIGRITLAVGNSDDWEADHLQYGIAAVPLPAALWLMPAALLGLGGFARRGHGRGS